jgi:hypothetical protein
LQLCTEPPQIPVENVTQLTLGLIELRRCYETIMYEVADRHPFLRFHSASLIEVQILDAREAQSFVRLLLSTTFAVVH